MEFRLATSKEQALAWLSELGDSACVVAGGTDVMMQYARGELSPAFFVHIERVKSLAVAEDARFGRLGALVTHRFLATDTLIQDRYPALAEAAATVGGWQTQAVGTLGGNLCNASPAADTAAPLLVADAVVELASSRGQRRVPLQEFFLGRRKVNRRPDELVTMVEAAPIGEHAGEVYLKVGRRGAMAVALVGLAARLTFDEEGRMSDARLAMCSVAPAPLRATEAEQILIEGGGSCDAVREAGEVLQRLASPIDDSRATAAYRLNVLPGLLEQAVGRCKSRALTRGGIRSAS